MKKFALIKSSESEILTQIAQSNLNESSLWKIPNLLVPLAAVILALITNLLFSTDRWDIFGYINIVVNGSLPLIAINQISGIGLHVFKFEKGKEAKYGLKIEFLRTKLFYYCVGVLVLGVLLFAFEVITNPFNSIFLAVVMLLVSGLFLFFSSYVAKSIFLLQENLIDNTFDKEIQKEADLTHGQEW